MAQDVLAELTQLLREVFDDEDIEVTRSTVACDIPGWDSLSNTVVMMTIENHFGIRFPGKSVFRNVGDLMDKIEELTGNI
jgi:acyl carrier protein